jgi:Flp pilus assembly protein TadG
MKDLNDGKRLTVWQRLLVPMRSSSREDGEMMLEFAMSCLVLIPILFGCIEACLGFYTYNFVADAAREATRYAMVRGSTSCANTPGLSNCGIGTTAPIQAIQTYVQGLGYPGLNASNLTATPTWLQATSNGSTTTWAACDTPCTQPGNQVQVLVQYRFPFGVPFIPTTSIHIASTSSMVISQ